MKKYLWFLWVLGLYLAGWPPPSSLVAVEPSGKSAATDSWGEPKEIVLPSPDGPLKAITQTFGDEKKIVFVPSKGLLWTGFAVYEVFFVRQDQIYGITPSYGFSVHSSSIKIKSSDPTSPLLRHELDVFLSKISSDPEFYNGNSVNIGPVLGRWLTQGPQIDGVETIDESELKVVNISFEKGNIMIELKKETGDKAVVTFTETMEPLRAVVGNKEVFVKGKKSPWDYNDIECAVQEGDIKGIKDILAKGFDIETKYQHGYTLLMEAASTGQTKSALALIAAGADVNKKDKYEGTPLMYATRAGHVEVAMVLIDKGAKLEATDSNGCTPLIIAIQELEGDTGTEIVLALIAKGADVNFKNKADNGNTPFMYVARTGNIEIAKALLAKGADMKAKDNGGSDCIGSAIKNGHKAFVDFLISKGWKLDKAMVDYMIFKGWKMDEKKSK